MPVRYHNSVPTSPNEMELAAKGKEKEESSQCSSSKGPSNLGCYSSSSGYVRTSKSEDHLQLQKDSLSAVDIDIDDDTTSSLNNLLDTRLDGAESSSSIATVAQGKDTDRIVWTYNAPLSDLQHQQHLQALQQQNSSDSNSISPNSPTSVSSSVMSSDNSSSKRVMLLNSLDGEVNNAGDYSEAISSPDFQVPLRSLKHRLERKRTITLLLAGWPRLFSLHINICVCLLCFACPIPPVGLLIFSSKLLLFEGKR